jgi:hypothetical protein
MRLLNKPKEPTRSQTGVQGGKKEEKKSKKQAKE